MAKNIKTVPTSEYQELVTTVGHYVEGLHIGSSERVSQAFHDDAVMYGHSNTGELTGGPISNLYDFVNQSGAAPNVSTHVDVLAVTPTTAVVAVDMENDSVGGSYTDFHTLVKIDGCWQIVAKAYHMYED